jgi:hypothetical protein
MGPWTKGQWLEVSGEGRSLAYHGAESVGRLADVELLVVPLPLSGSHVVNDGVAPDVLPGILFADPKTRLADNDANLAFIVKALGEPLVRVDILAVSDDRSGSLGEDDGVARRVDLVGAVVPGTVELAGVLHVVFANGEDIAP